MSLPLRSQDRSRLFGKPSRTAVLVVSGGLTSEYYTSSRVALASAFSASKSLKFLPLHPCISPVPVRLFCLHSYPCSAEGVLYDCTLHNAKTSVRFSKGEASSTRTDCSMRLKNCICFKRMTLEQCSPYSENLYGCMLFRSMRI